MIKDDAMGGRDAEVAMQCNLNYTSVLSAVDAVLLFPEVVLVLAAVKAGWLACGGHMGISMHVTDTGTQTRIKQSQLDKQREPIR